MSDFNYEDIAFDDELALESLFAELEDDSDIAQEGLFNKKKDLEQLIAKVKKSVGKCKTEDQCDDLLAKLNEEASKFNELILSMRQAAVDCKDGTITEKEFKEKVKSAAKEIKKTCDILVLGQIVKDEKDVQNEDIQLVKDFIEGATEVIKARKEELAGGGEGEEPSMESFINALNLFDNDDIATEGVVTYSLKTYFNPKKKEAVTLVKEGSVLMRRKNYAEAIKKFNDAKKLYNELLTRLDKIPEMKQYTDRSSNGTTTTRTVNPYLSKSMAEESIKALIFKCDEKIEKCNDKLAKGKATESFTGFDDDFAAFDIDEDEE